MAGLIKLLVKIGSYLGLAWLFTDRGKKKLKIEGLEDKVTAMEIEDELEELSDDDVTAGLTGWVRPEDE